MVVVVVVVVMVMVYLDGILAQFQDPFLFFRRGSGRRRRESILHFNPFQPHGRREREMFFHVLVCSPGGMNLLEKKKRRRRRI